MSIGSSRSSHSDNSFSRSQSTGSDLGTADAPVLPTNDRIAYEANPSHRGTIDGKATPLSYNLVRSYTAEARFIGSASKLSRADYKAALSSLKKASNFTNLPGNEKLSEEQVKALRAHAKALDSHAKTVVANQNYIDKQLAAHTTPSPLIGKSSSKTLKRSFSPEHLKSTQERLYGEDVLGDASAELGSGYFQQVHNIRNARAQLLSSLGGA